jgi:hypothetical protein
VEGVRCHAGMGTAWLVFIRPRLGTRGLALGALGLQVIGSERGDRAVLAAGQGRLLGRGVEGSVSSLARLGGQACCISS